MNIVDIILGAFLLLGMVRGLYKGFLIELAGLLALIAGILAAFYFSQIAYDFLSLFLPWNPDVLAVIAFAVTFFTVALGISLAGKVLTKVVSLMALGLINRLLGGMFGLLKMAFLVSLFLMLLGNFDLFAIDKDTQDNSVLLDPVRACAPLVLPNVIEKFEEGDVFQAPDEKEPG